MSKAGLCECSAAKFAFVDTTWGVCAVVWRREAGKDVLSRILLPGMGVKELREVIREEEGALEEVARPEWWSELAGLLQGYFGEDPREAMAHGSGVWERWGKRLDLGRLTQFQREVLQATAAIAAGEVATYGQVAERVGRAGAARAVGGALGANPWPVLIPCHRVVGSGGALRGFSAPGGCVAKQRMIEWERGRG